jgi:hypothetical protein
MSNMGTRAPKSGSNRSCGIGRFRFASVQTHGPALEIEQEIARAALGWMKAKWAHGEQPIFIMNRRVRAVGHDSAKNRGPSVALPLTTIDSSVGSAPRASSDSSGDVGNESEAIISAVAPVSRGWRSFGLMVLSRRARNSPGTCITSPLASPVRCTRRISRALQRSLFQEKSAVPRSKTTDL